MLLQNLIDLVGDTIISLKPYVNQLTGAWLNSFVFIEQDNTSVDIFYYIGQPTENNKVPQFDNYISVQKRDANFRCSDVDFLSQTKFIVDCKNLDKNYFVEVDTTEKVTFIENIQKFDAPSIRQLLVHTFEYVTGSQQFIIRGQYQEGKGSLVEVFQVKDGNITVEPWLTLDSESLAILLNQQQTFNFVLLDMQVEPNGDLFILDSFNGIYVLKILQSQKWLVKEWSRLNFGEQIYAFDFNYLFTQDGQIAQLALVYEDRIQYFQNNEPKGLLQLPGKVQGVNIQIEISQKYIVLKYQEKIFIYDQKQLLYSFFEDVVDIIIINPYEPDLIGVNFVSTHRFLINDGILRLQKQDSKTDQLYQTKILAQSKSGNQCSIDLKIQIVYSTDTQLYETGFNALPSALTIPSDPFNVDLLAIGPDISYTPVDATTSDSIVIDIQEMWKLNIKIQQEHVVFTDIQVIDVDKFQLLQQLESKEAYIYECQHDQLKNVEAECNLLKQVAFQSILTKTTFHWWFETKKIFFVIQESEKQIHLYGFDKESKSFAEYDKLTLEEKIQSFNVLYNKMFVVIQNKILVYDQFIPFNLAYTISDIVQPLNVFGNRLIDLIFIQTSSQVIIGNLALLSNGGAFTTIQTITTLPDSQIKIAIGKHYFYLLQKTATDFRIDEYNYKHLQVIYRTKTLPLYNYKLQDSIVADSCEESGWLFVRGQDDKQTVILIYEPGVLSHQSLKKVIKLEGKVDTTVEVDGGLQMFLHFQQKVYSVLQDSLFSVQSKIHSDNYLNKVVTGVKASNDYSSKNIYKQISVLDTHSQPIFENPQNQSFKVKKDSESASLMIDTKLYTGQITQISIDCKSCSQAKLQPQIRSVSDGLNLFYNFIDGLIYDAHYGVFLTSKQLVFAKRDGQFEKVFTLGLSILEQTDGLYISEDRKYLVVSVLAATPQILIVDCGTNLECTVVSKITVPNTKRISGVQLFNNNHLFILDSNPQDLTQFESSIQAFYINADKTLTLSRSINAQLLNLNSLKIASFQVIKHNQFYTVFFTDLNFGLRINHFKLLDFSYIPNIEHFELRNYQNDQFYVHENTEFQTIKLISSEMQGTLQTFNLLIQTNNVAQYVFGIPFEIGNLPDLILDKIKLKFVLTPFGSWTSVNKVATYLNYVLVPYRKGQDAILVMYELVDSNVTKTITSHYALYENYKGTLSNQIVLTVEVEDNSTYFFANLKYDETRGIHNLIKYQYQQNSIINFESLTSVEEQPITITVSNYYGKASGVVNLVYVDDNDDDDDESDHSWIWILVGVLGGIIILLVTLCLLLYFWNRRNKKSVALLE
ncbi:unnamed protein product (macronuclear) [Paramecium tetraurelia]|uniref:Transmembrane protein n=1 Tax=Paramecium tetraurelia TaxID=5888 RepID=A0CP79_PARTE|nr:uncharacterized protein GSPATT00008987001 [Paramecium tetraurelia]CAK72596.1 unnamed protein product [Paramecium tetraurelia]|eukprot:XP_001439993.1 hypothetical protein (macronuclear) [Paramecium tetraurelia strain d4-2]